MKPYLTIGILILLIACGNNTKNTHALTEVSAVQEDTLVSLQCAWYPEGTTLEDRFFPPVGFVRTTASINSFASFLRTFPLKESTAKVYHYDGSPKWNQNLHVSVLDIDAGGKRDLQQCADAVMRLRAEYLYSEKRYKDIHFNLTNGFRMDYSKWMQGYRVKVSGNKTTWYKAGEASNTQRDFMKYLRFVFTYAGTYSLSKELKTKDLNQIEPGDVFIQGGFPGHAVIVMDVVLNENTSERRFLLAQSYMPAQDIHVLKNPESDSDCPWYSTKSLHQLITPEWTFNSDDLKSW